MRQTGVGVSEHPVFKCFEHASNRYLHMEKREPWNAREYDIGVQTTLSVSRSE